MNQQNYALALVKAAMLRASAVCESRSRSHSDPMASLEAGKCGRVIESLIEREAGTIIAAVPRPEPVAAFEDQDVQRVYDLICADDAPPDGDHWEGVYCKTYC